MPASYPYAGAVELLARPEPLLVALDQIQDPQNLGSIGKDRRVRRGRRSDHPRAARRRGHARGVQGIGRRCRALPDRTRAQHRRLPRRRTPVRAAGAMAPVLPSRTRRTGATVRPSATTSPIMRAPASCSCSAARAPACAARRLRVRSADRPADAREDRVARRERRRRPFCTRSCRIATRVRLTRFHNCVRLAPT